MSLNDRVCIVIQLKLQYVLYNNGVVIYLLFYNCKADISSSGNESTHCAENVKQVFSKGKRGDEPSERPAGTVQVIHPAHISSVLVQLRYI